MLSMNNPLVSEASPLLPARYLLDELNTTPIIPLVQALETADLSHLRWEDLTPRTISTSFEMDPCKRLAFALIVLLQLRKYKIAWKGRYPADSYEQWTEEEARARDVETLEEKLSELWENFLAQYHGPRDLHDVLWTPFLLKRNTSRTIRVVDFLADRDAPSKFVAHPIISMTMSRTWKYGRPENNHPQSMLHNIFNTNATPCKTHCLELIFDLGFIFLLLSYVVRPPNWPESDANSAFSCPYSAREVCMVIYAFSVLVSARGANVVLSTLTLIAFTLSPATLPLPGSSRFYILLWVIFFRFFMYHVPTILPGPNLLVQHQHSFPLAVFLSQGLTRIIRPLFSFYFLIILAACLALSISMSGPLTGPLTYLYTLQATLPTPGSDLPIVGVAPMDTRIIFFLLSVTVSLLVLSSAYILGSSTPVARANPVIFSSSTAWEIYSPEIGHIARIASYRATVAYADEYPFPPPFSVVKLLLVTIPVGLIRLLGNSNLRRATIARPVWNLTVRPLMMIMTPLCTFLA